MLFLHCLQEAKYITSTELQLMTFKILKDCWLTDEVKLLAVVEYFEQFGLERCINPAGTVYHCHQTLTPFSQSYFIMLVLLCMK